MDTPVSKTVFDVPRSHWHCELANFKWPSEEVKDVVGRFMTSLLIGKKTNLLFTGTPGNGKTHLAIALYRWGVLQWGTLHCALVMVPDFFHIVKESFNQPDRFDPFGDLEEAKKLVVLDDILGRSPTPWELDHIIFRLVNVSYTNGASVVVTTNYTLKELAGILKPHEFSRLREGALHIEFSGQDHRLT